MSGALRKTMAYLGLAEDEAGEYGEDVEGRYPEEQRETETRTHERPAAAERTAQVTPMRVVPTPEPVEQDLRRISTVHPTTYNEARVIGESFRDGTPVIMNLTGMSESEAKRMVDFSAGLVFGLHGAIERVTNRVFLLSPASVEIATDAGEPESGPGRLFNQS